MSTSPSSCRRGAPRRGRVVGVLTLGFLTPAGRRLNNVAQYWDSQPRQPLTDLTPTRSRSRQTPQPTPENHR
jgi:hypothetical protein